MLSGSCESMKATNAGVCLDMLTMVREQTFRSAAAAFPMRGSKVLQQSGSHVVQAPASEKRSENENEAMVSQLSRGRTV